MTAPGIASSVAPVAAQCGRPRRKTKLVCTLGPASCEPDQIRGLIQAGANVFRMNFSHSDHAWHSRVLADIRAVADQQQTCVAVMQDLCGPKIRLSKVLQQDYHVGEGDLIRITTDHHLVHLEGESGLHFDIASTYAPLVDDVNIGDTILLDDGSIELRVADKQHGLLVAEVRRGGPILPGKGLNLPGVALSTESMTAKDWADLEWGIANGVDFVALSFVRHPDDLVGVRSRLDESKSKARLIAKIERPEAIEHLDAILTLADGLMVARGDLGLETDLAQVPLLQKHVIDRCRQAAKPVITATQMLESMVHHSTPTRAEVSDVANAIYDGSDAIMLSGETAMGRFPVEAVRMLHQVAMVTEADCGGHRALSEHPSDLDASVEAIVEGAALTARRLHAKAVVVYSRGGSTARLITRYRLPMPVVAVTNVESTYRQLGLSYGVSPVHAPHIATLGELLEGVDALVLEEGLAKPGDTLVVVSSLDGRDGNTDTLNVRHIRA